MLKFFAESAYVVLVNSYIYGEHVCRHFRVRHSEDFIPAAPKMFVFIMLREQKREDNRMGRYFGTDGFRGEANKTLTVEHAYKVGRFLGWKQEPFPIIAF